MFQRTQLIGRLGSDPELRYTPDGVAVASFSVATTKTISKDGPNGERPCPKGWVESYNKRNWEVTTWWRVTTWRSLAETCNQFLSKGREVFVEGEVGGTAEEGKMVPNAWNDKNTGEARSSYELTANTVKFIGGNGGTRELGEPPPDEGPLPL